MLPGRLSYYGPNGRHFFGSLATREATNYYSRKFLAREATNIIIHGNSLHVVHAGDTHTQRTGGVALFTCLLRGWGWYLHALYYKQALVQNYSNSNSSSYTC